MNGNPDAKPSKPDVISPSPKEREHVTSPYPEVLANGYRTKGTQTFEIGGEKQEYHLVKGGIAPEKLQNIRKARILPAFGIYFSPEKGWLKVTPAGVNENVATELAHRLRNASTVLQESLRISGLPNLVQQVVFYEDLGVAGERIAGYTSPHIGPSIEQFLLEQTGILKPDAQTCAALPSEVRATIGEYYQAGFNNSLRLYLQHGYWTEDPNPGNLLIAQDNEGNNRVVVIDFEGGDTIKDPLKKERDLSKVPKERRDILKRNMYRQILHDVQKLHSTFQRHATRLGAELPFDTSPNNQQLHIYITTMVEARFAEIENNKIASSSETISPQGKDELLQEG